MRPSRILLLLLIVAFGLRFGMQYAELPPVVASHFGVDGQPNGFMSKQVFLLFGLLPLGIAALIGLVVPRVTRAMPVSLINLPNREHWLAPGRKDEALAYLSSYLEWVSVGMLAFFIFVYELVFRANAEHTGLANGPFLTGLATFMVLMLLSLVALVRRFALPKA
jgi:uncharacterized membrane protein